uniref:Uncharacterized protein n=1 Tax=Timema douglasi TaxID=61478 RepID=A0A7R8Z9I7_TIMDO|nr:unnamed protein product [Timema douglasi]
MFYFQDKDEQTSLEMKHRKEEDDLYRKFARQREEEDKRMREEFRDEWEKELERLAVRFERELQTKKKRPDEQKVLTLRHQQEREDLEKNMTLRRDKKKESLTRKLLEHESSLDQHETSALANYATETGSSVEVSQSDEPPRWKCLSEDNENGWHVAACGRTVSSSQDDRPSGPMSFRRWRKHSA